MKGPGMLRTQLLGSEVPLTKKDSKHPVSPFFVSASLTTEDVRAVGVWSWTKTQGNARVFSTF